MISQLSIFGLYGVTLAYMAGVIATHSAGAAAAGAHFITVLRSFILETVFQLVANLLLPTQTVHAAVHYSKEVLLHWGVKGLLGEWGPTALGLSLIPLFPLLDPPIERLIHKLFAVVWPESNAKRD